ncbi:histidine phosphatase family protein [Thalassotalea sp. M1531]|uniref:Histidine phosphatase family protein n=1 Tax=Thalassotalea algicola TaxID=2716224 RepID=A0A7Y0LCD0_9GAMM|nr:histidine phosphatase family protein [Thalassotalea algicola]NMP31619.1 histidine phosphatase family protein [Thalassotalea algicola]
MAALYLVRHGQASFGEPEYDQLTQKGRQQGVMLGQSWQTLPRPEKIYTGLLRRHTQTFQAFNEQVKLNSAVNVLKGLNEFDHNDILISAQPHWQNQQDVINYFAKLPSPKEALNKAFNQALATWVDKQHSQHYQENWSTFKSRCISAFNRIIEDREIEEQQIIAFTSGGVIAVIIQHLLQLSDQQCLNVMQQLRNTGVTKILFSVDRISLDYFNNYRHLEQVGASWSTYR